jgi:hypothetical protein
MQLWVEQKSCAGELPPDEPFAPDEDEVPPDEQLVETDPATFRNVDASESKSDGAAVPRTAIPVPQSFRK